MFQIATLVLFSTLFTFSGLAKVVPCELNKSTLEKVKLSTYKIVPIDLFARELSEEEARRLHKQECLSPKIHTYERLNCKIFSKCKDNACKRSFTQDGSAFLLGDGQSLVTAWHITYNSHSSALRFLEDYLSTLDNDTRNNKLSVLKPAFILLDHEERTVFDTREHLSGTVKYLDWGNPLSPIYAKKGIKKNGAYGFYESASEDFALISLPESIGPSLQSGTLRTKECLYSIGQDFQEKTMKLVTSGGRKTTFKQLREKNSQMKKPLAAEQRHLRDQTLDQNENIIFFKASVSLEQRGGPLVNDQGEVIGITTHRFINHHNESPLSAGVARLIPIEWME